MEEHRGDVFSPVNCSGGFCLAITYATDLVPQGRIARAIRSRHGDFPIPPFYRPFLLEGDVFGLSLCTRGCCKLFILFVKARHDQPAMVSNLSKSLEKLSVMLSDLQISRLAIPKLGCGRRDGLDWEEDVKPLVNRHLVCPGRTIRMYSPE